MWELQCLGVIMCGSCGLRELRGMGIAVCESCGVCGMGRLQHGRFFVEGVALWGHCGVGCSVGESQHGEVACIGEFLVWGSCGVW